MSEDTPSPIPPEEGQPHPEPTPAPAHKVDDPLGPKRRRSFWRSLGGEGLTVSIAIHAALILLAAYFVVSTIETQSQKKTDTFATGAGGGSAGDRVKSTQHKVTPKNVKTLSKSVSRITSKSASSSIALPELPASASASSMISGMMAGGPSKGFGGGAGGGIGSVKGMGVGNARNFVAKPVLGANVFAQRLAVYMDASPSMLPYLEQVENEVRRAFPDADVFVYNGAFIDVQDEDVVGGLRMKAAPVAINRSTSNAKKKDAKGVEKDVTTSINKLTAAGKSVYGKYDANFKRGSLGAWIDVLREERTYDALVIFSDFADGIRQVRNKGYRPEKNMKAQPPVVFSDRRNEGIGTTVTMSIVAASSSSGQPVLNIPKPAGIFAGMLVTGPGIPPETFIRDVEGTKVTLTKNLQATVAGPLTVTTDRRHAEEKKWEDEWIKDFAAAKDGKGPRLYLLSTQYAYGSKPGNLLQRCVEASEGAATMLKWGTVAKGGTTITNLHNYDDLVVGMQINAKQLEPGTEIAALPVRDKDGKITTPLKITKPALADGANVVLSFRPLIQVVGSIAKGSKTIEELSSATELRVGMAPQGKGIAPGTLITKVIEGKGGKRDSVELSKETTSDEVNALFRFKPLDVNLPGSRSIVPTR